MMVSDDPITMEYLHTYKIRSSSEWKDILKITPLYPTIPFVSSIDVVSLVTKTNRIIKEIIKHDIASSDVIDKKYASVNSFFKKVLGEYVDHTTTISTSKPTTSFESTIFTSTSTPIRCTSPFTNTSFNDSSNIPFAASSTTSCPFNSSTNSNASSFPFAPTSPPASSFPFVSSSPSVSSFPFAPTSPPVSKISFASSSPSASSFPFESNSSSSPAHNPIIQKVKFLKKNCYLHTMVAVDILRSINMKAKYTICFLRKIVVHIDNIIKYIDWETCFYKLDHKFSSMCTVNFKLRFLLFEYKCHVGNIVDSICTTDLESLLPDKIFKEIAMKLLNFEIVLKSNLSSI